jgi:hypothetical protein
MRRKRKTCEPLCVPFPGSKPTPSNRSPQPGALLPRPAPLAAPAPPSLPSPFPPLVSVGDSHRMRGTPASASGGAGDRRQRIPTLERPGGRASPTQSLRERGRSERLHADRCRTTLQLPAANTARLATPRRRAHAYDRDTGMPRPGWLASEAADAVSSGQNARCVTAVHRLSSQRRRPQSACGWRPPPNSPLSHERYGGGWVYDQRTGNATCAAPWARTGVEHLEHTAAGREGEALAT